MSAWRGIPVLLAVAACVLGGCRRQPDPPSPPDPPPQAPPDRTAATPSADAMVMTSNDGTYQVTCLPRPNPIPTNAFFTLEVVVRTAGDNRPVPSRVMLSADAAMPAHGHGMNTQPAVSRLEPGRFEVRGMLFHMSGHWELYFDLTDGPLTERAQCDVTLE